MFDYFHVSENEQYLFLQMPLMLIKDEKFKSLSDGAKILYSLLLNRTSLSAKNGWADKQGRVYIIYTQEEIMTDLNCWEKKATKSMKELKEIGLVKSIRQGLGKPNIIYVMNFATALKYQSKDKKGSENLVNSMICQIDISENAQKTFPETVQRTFQEVSKGHTINNDFKKIYTEKESVKASKSLEGGYSQWESDTTRYDVIDDTAQQNSSKMEKGHSLTTTYDSGLKESPSTNTQINLNDYTTYTEWESIVKNNIGYEHFVQERHPYIRLIDEIVYNILDLLTETNDFIMLNKKENKKIRTPDAKIICERLKHEHILYVLEKFNNTTGSITNKGNYLKTIILSSIKEMESHYQNEFRQGNL